MADKRAIVKVILATEDHKEINSPIMSRDEAESDAKTIDECRQGMAEIDLPWLKMNGGLILAVHLEARSAA